MMTTMFLSSTATDSHRDSCEIAATLEQPILADGERCLEEHCLLPDDVVTSGGPWRRIREMVLGPGPR